MKIIEIKVLKGPNYWSIRRPKLIQMKLDLEEMEQRPTNKIPGFRERLEKWETRMVPENAPVVARPGDRHDNVAAPNPLIAARTISETGRR